MLRLSIFGSLWEIFWKTVLFTFSQNNNFSERKLEALALQNLFNWCNTTFPQASSCKLSRFWQFANIFPEISLLLKMMSLRSSKKFCSTTAHSSSIPYQDRNSMTFTLDDIIDLDNRIWSPRLNLKKRSRSVCKFVFQSFCIFGKCCRWRNIVNGCKLKPLSLYRQGSDT